MTFADIILSIIEIRFFHVFKQIENGFELVFLRVESSFFLSNASCKKRIFASTALDPECYQEPHQKSSYIVH